METKPTTNTMLNDESQAVIRKMLLTLDALCGNNSLWKYDELEKAMEQMFQGDFSVPSFSRPRLKLAYLIIRRQILHLLTLESSIQQEKEEVITPTPQCPRHIITPKPLPAFKESPQKAKNSPPATQWKGGVPRRGGGGHQNAERHNTSTQRHNPSTQKHTPTPQRQTTENQLTT